MRKKKSFRSPKKLLTYLKDRETALVPFTAEELELQRLQKKTEKLKRKVSHEAIHLYQKIPVIKVHFPYQYVDPQLALDNAIKEFNEVKTPSSRSLDFSLDQIFCEQFSQKKKDFQNDLKIIDPSDGFVGILDDLQTNETVEPHGFPWTITPTQAEIEAFFREIHGKIVKITLSSELDALYRFRRKLRGIKNLILKILHFTKTGLYKVEPSLSSKLHYLISVFSIERINELCSRQANINSLTLLIWQTNQFPK